MEYREAYEPFCFQELMEVGRDAKRNGIERLAYMGSAVTHVRPRLVERWTADQAAAFLGVSVARVKLLCGSRRIKGARRSKTGKGSPWLVPAHRQPDGTYAVCVIPRQKGPPLRVLSVSPADRDEVPL